MKAEYINPFISSLTSTFSTMLNVEPRRTGMTIGDPRKRKHPISGVIGLSGRAVGTVVLNIPESLALRAASILLMEEQTEVTNEVLDAVGELTNMVAGQAKSELDQFQLSLSLPNVITGIGHEIRFPAITPPICVSFETSIGPILLEVGFEMQDALVGV